MGITEHPLHKYIRPHIQRTTMCPGCGNGMIAQAILRAVDELELNIDDFVFVSGIGCSAWIPSPFFAADTLHTTHSQFVYQLDDADEILLFDHRSLQAAH